MSAALVEPIVESPQTAVEVLQTVSKPKSAQIRDEHPLAPVFIIGAMALIGALAFVGSIMMWLVLRHTGVMAP